MSSPLSAEQQASVDEVTKIEEDMLALIGRLMSSPADKRWIAIAKTHIEEGAMAARRGITRPPPLPKV